MHCTACGAPLPAHPPTTCESCGTRAWADAKPCACALVTDRDGKLLLIKRASEPWNGYWDIPGGFCDGAEHPITAAVRETFEETGFRIEVTSFLGIWLAPYDDATTNEPPKVTMDIFYEATLADETPQTPQTPHSHEVQEVQWFAHQDIPDAIAFPEAQRPALHAWLQRQRRGEVAILPDRPTV